jgi:hypothetical protein
LVTITFSEKLTWIEISSPEFYEPLGVDELTLVTVGAVTSEIVTVVDCGDPAREV